MKQQQKQTIEERWQPRPLTRKQRAFADHYIDNPKDSGTAAALATYDTTDPATAAMIAFENLRKPNIQAYLDIHSQQASDTMIEVLEVSKREARTGTREGASYAAVAVSAAKDILDRLHGKATTRVEVSSKSVSVNIDLTGSLPNPTEVKT